MTVVKVATRRQQKSHTLCTRVNSCHSGEGQCSVAQCSGNLRCQFCSGNLQWRVAVGIGSGNLQW